MNVFEIYDDYIGLESLADKSEMSKLSQKLISLLKAGSPLTRDLVESWNRTVIQVNMQSKINEEGYCRSNQDIFLALMKGKTQYYAKFHPEDRNFERKVRELCQSLGLI